MKCFSGKQVKWNKMLLRFPHCCLAAVLILALSGCGEQSVEKAEKTDTAMGTIIRQTLYLEEKEPEETGAAGEEAALDGVMELIDVLEKELLSWRIDTSQVYRINENAGREEGVEPGRELYDILQKVWSVSEKSGGALDVTIGDVVRLWDIDSYAAGEKEEDFEVPQENLLMQALEDTGYELVSFSDGRIWLPREMKLDLGAVGKGIACGKILKYLAARQDVTGAVISVGGSIVTYGEKPDKTPWKVGILDPGDTGSYLGVLQLEGGWCVSTSGDYERYVEADGVRYHHILDPSDGYPADSGVTGVTVLSRDGLLSDALSTACFVLGTEEGMILAEEFQAEALFVETDGSIRMTEGMKPYFLEN